MAGKKTPNYRPRDLFVRAEAVEVDSQFLDAEKPVFCSFLLKFLIVFGQFLGLSDLGIGKTVPLAKKVIHIVRKIEGFLICWQMTGLEYLPCHRGIILRQIFSVTSFLTLKDLIELAF